MTLVQIKSPELTSEQKKRIGDRIISAFHGEGFSSGSVVVLFEREVADLLLDGGLLFEAQPRIQAEPVALAPVAALPRPPAPALDLDLPADFKSKSRRSKVELAELKARLVTQLRTKGALSSFQAQIELGLKTCDWAPATLRRFFSELEEEGAIFKEGQKRGTRYVWRGEGVPAVNLMPRLVKRQEEEAGE